MKNIKKGSTLLLFLLLAPMVASCNSDNSTTIEEFLKSINTSKNYTYKYEFKSNDGTSFSYEDKFTPYGMYSKVIKDESEDATDFGYLVNKDDGVFSYVIENDKVIPGRAIRDNEGKQRNSYSDLIVALDDLTTSNVDYKLINDKYTHKITNKSAMTTIVESSMVNFENAMATLNQITINTSNADSIKIEGNFKDASFVGYVTDIGNTKLDLGKKYIDDGKGAYVKSSVDAPYKEIIDMFKTNNYEAPLMQILGGISVPVGVRSFYEYTTSSGEKALVHFRNFEDVQKADGGMIELHDGDYDGLYTFQALTDKQIEYKDKIDQLEKDDNPHHNLEILDEVKLNNKHVKTFDEVLIFPTSLNMFKGEALLMDYNDVLKGYLSEDYVLSVQLCAYFNYQHTLQFAPPNYAGVVKTKDPETNEDYINLIYSWKEKNDIGAAALQFSNFGKVSLPFVDEFMETTYGK